MKNIKEEKPKTLSPDAILFEGIVKGVIRSGFMPENAGGFVTGFANFLRTIPEDQRVETMLDIVHNPEKHHKEFGDIAEIALDNGAVPPQTVPFLLELERTLTDIPATERTKTFNPDFIADIAKEFDHPRH